MRSVARVGCILKGGLVEAVEVKVHALCRPVPLVATLVLLDLEV